MQSTRLSTSQTRRISLAAFFAVLFTFVAAFFVAFFTLATFFWPFIPVNTARPALSVLDFAMA